jgi:hypothetical protein
MKLLQSIKSLYGVNCLWSYHTEFNHNNGQISGFCNCTFSSFILGIEVIGSSKIYRSTIHRGSIHRGSIHRRVMSTENLNETWNFLAGHTIQGFFVVKTFSSPLCTTWKQFLLKSTWLKCIIFGLNMETVFI